MSLLDESLAVSSELGMRPLMERVLSRRWPTFSRTRLPGTRPCLKQSDSLYPDTNFLNG